MKKYRLVFLKSILLIVVAFTIVTSMMDYFSSITPLSWEEYASINYTEIKKENDLRNEYEAYIKDINFTNILKLVSVIEDSGAKNDTMDTWNIALSIFHESNKYGYSPYFLLSVIEAESNFDIDVVSNKGAVGLMQILPSTGEFLAKQMGDKWEGEKSLYNISTNIRYGAFYLYYLKKRFNTIDRVLAAYNMGPAAVTKSGVKENPFSRTVIGKMSNRKNDSAVDYKEYKTMKENSDPLSVSRK